MGEDGTSWYPWYGGIGAEPGTRQGALFIRSVGEESSGQPLRIDTMIKPSEDM